MNIFKTFALLLLLLGCSIPQRVPSSSPKDWFERRPYVALFEAGGKRIGLIGLHAKPNHVVKELNKLDDVYFSARRVLEENNFILMGDFNAGCRYLSKKRESNLDLTNNKNFQWLITRADDTNISKSHCSYDRMVKAGSISFVEGRGRVRKSGIKRTMSDHYLIWAPVKFGKKTIKVASWNIQNLGEKKASNKTVMKNIGKVIDDYDIIFVQEIMGKSNLPIRSLMANIPAHYSYIQSRPLGRGSYLERYAYIYNRNKLKLVESYVFSD